MGDKFRFVFYGDVHLMNRLSSVKHFKKEVVEKYKDQHNTFFVDMGDGLDCIIAQTRDKRFRASMIDERYLGIDNPVDVAVEDYCKLLHPIKDRILAMVDSNHHMSLMDSTGTDVTRRIAFSLWGPEGVERRLLGYAGFMGIIFYYADDTARQFSRARRVVFSLCHGIGTGGKTEGGFITSLGNDAVNYLADVHVYAHNHRLSGWDRIKIGPDDRMKKIVSRKEIRLNSGTYLKAFSDDCSTSYAEKARFKPNELGHMELNIRIHRQGEEIYWVKRSIT